MRNISEQQNATLFEKSWLLVAEITIFYSFYIQYCIRSVGGAMVILCGLLILFALLQIVVNQRGHLRISNMYPFVMFCILASVSTILFTSHGLYGTDLSVRVIEYIFASYSMYLMLRNNPRNIDRIMWCFCISIFLLAITSIMKGVQVSSTGAIGIESLNINSMSSYFLLMIFCSFYLLSFQQKLFRSLILLIMDTVIIVAQIMTASRRGFLVLAAFLFMSISFVLVPYKIEIKSKKRFAVYILLFLAVIVALSYFQNYILSNTLLGARLLGQFDGGDFARKKYQAYALEQFKSHPILGIGLGGIAYQMGAYSHSMYYELLSCSGIFGSALFLYGLIKIVIDSCRIRKCSKNTNKMTTYICGIIIVFVACVAMSGIAVVMIYDFYFYLSVAVVSAVLSEEKVLVVQDDYE